jgi:hypothetical protein
MTTLTLTEKLHAQQIRKRLLNGYPPESAFCALMASITGGGLTFLTHRPREAE